MARHAIPVTSGGVAVTSGYAPVVVYGPMQTFAEDDAPALLADAGGSGLTAQTGVMQGGEVQTVASFWEADAPALLLDAGGAIGTAQGSLMQGGIPQTLTPFWERDAAALLEDF